MVLAGCFYLFLLFLFYHGSLFQTQQEIIFTIDLSKTNRPPVPRNWPMPGPRTFRMCWKPLAQIVACLNRIFHSTKYRALTPICGMRLKKSSNPTIWIKQRPTWCFGRLRPWCIKWSCQVCTVHARKQQGSRRPWGRQSNHTLLPRRSERAPIVLGWKKSGRGTLLSCSTRRQNLKKDGRQEHD